MSSGKPSVLYRHLTWDSHSFPLPSTSFNGSVCVCVIPIFRNEEPHFSQASRDIFAYIEMQERKKLFLVNGLVLFT